MTSTAFTVHVRLYHHSIDVADLVPSDVPGYWKATTPCPGGDRCTHAFRGFLGPCDGTTPRTVYFAQHGRDDRGRFLRPHREWEKQRSIALAEGGELPEVLRG